MAPMHWDKCSPSWYPRSSAHSQRDGGSHKAPTLTAHYPP
jgi:hypothetical protein